MPVSRRIAACAAVAAALTIAPALPAAAHPHGPVVSTLVGFTTQGSGSTIGPDGALYVTDGPAAKVWRINTRTGEQQEFDRVMTEFLATVG